MDKLLVVIEKLLSEEPQQGGSDVLNSFESLKKELYSLFSYEIQPGIGLDSISHVNKINMFLVSGKALDTPSRSDMQFLKTVGAEAQLEMMPLEPRRGPLTPLLLRLM